MIEKIDGWLVVNKPCGVTSARAVSQVKRALKIKKVGHAGTLDPLASGVLPLALGEATKTVRFLMSAVKEYEFTVSWGEETATGDSEGECIANSDVRPSRDEILSVLPQFIGEIDQTPPIYSAIKIKGKRAYELAREGKSVKMKSRLVKIDKLEMTDHKNDKSASFRVKCGKGTYIRSLARDLARSLGTVGHVTCLLRTRVGPFAIKDAILLEKWDKTLYNPLPSGLLFPVEHVLDDIPVLCFTPEEARVFSQGQRVCLTADIAEEQFVSVQSGGRLLAIGQTGVGFVKPVRVFNF